MPIVILTNTAQEAEMQAIVAALGGLDGVAGPIQRIRVADFAGAV